VAGLVAGHPALAPRRPIARLTIATGTVIAWLVELRPTGEIGNDAFHVIEEELNSFEFYTERRLARLTSDVG
jgi:hypothetical protein